MDVQQLAQEIKELQQRVDALERKNLESFASKARQATAKGVAYAITGLAAFHKVLVT